MNILALKLILAPVIIGGASLAGRRWGPAVSGWLIGLPLTSGPVVFLITLSNGTAFAVSTALGTLSGGLSLVAFCLSYTWLARRFRWPVATLGSMTCFTVVTIAMQNIVLPLFIIFLLVLLAILGGVQLLPTDRELFLINEVKPGKWDLPARILIGTTFILGLTGIAPFIGARLTGLLSTIPLYTAILTIFAQRLQGPAGANSVLRGLLFGLFGFTGFYLVLALMLEQRGPVLAFSAAILATILIQGISFLVLKIPHH